MAIRIITDSSCDIPHSIQSELGIDIIPMIVTFGQEEYLDGRDMDATRFYELLRQTEELPKTTQLTPHQFEEIIRPYVEAGDSVILMPISSELSGTYTNACIAAKSFSKSDVAVIDTLAVTFSLGLLIRIAVKLRDDGVLFEELVNKINDIKSRIRLFAVVADLKYLRMGGRLSSAGAVVGSILGIKPIITIKDGKVHNIDKVRGMRAGYQSVIDHAKKHGIDSEYPIAFGHSDLPEAMTELMAAASDLEYKDFYTSNIGPIVGTHAGPGATGVAFVAK